MAVFDFEQEDVGVWFDYPDGGRVKLKGITAEDLIEIAAKCIKQIPIVHEPEGKKPVILVHEQTDQDLQVRLMNDKTILDWEGFTKKGGEEIPCTTENKTKLMFIDAKFRKFVREKIETLETILTEIEDSQKKT